MEAKTVWKKNKYNHLKVIHGLALLGKKTQNYPSVYIHPFNHEQYKIPFKICLALQKW